MRPTRLELEGFASFRQHTVVDFDGADLFVLTGPTGAGKSSVIDAIAFALYGSVPRYDNRSLVWPVITQGQVEARVRLDFVVDGTSYSIARVVRKTGERAATTKEARLERDGVVLAGTADEVSAGVERIIGLPFEHFIKCVVLPQGDVAEFLHATAKERQDLLVRLLDLDVYRRVAQAANRRAAEHDTTVQLLTRRLDDEFAGATPEALAAATTRRERLTGLFDLLDAAVPELAAIVEEGRAARSEVAAAAAQLAALEGIAQPADAADLAERDRAARSAVADAVAQVEAATAARERASAAFAELPGEGVLVAALDVLARYARAQAAVAESRVAAEAAVAVAGDDDVRLGEALAAHATAAQQLDALRATHAAHALAVELVAGQPCPVCTQPVGTLPTLTKPAGLDEAEAAVAAADTQRRATEAAAAAAREGAASAQATLAGHERHAVELEAEVVTRTEGLTVAEPERLGALLEHVREQTRGVADADVAVAAAKAAERDATAALAALDADRAAAWSAFDGARDRVASLRPPAPDRDDLHGAWAALVAWGSATLEKVRADTDAARVRVEDAERRWRERDAQLRAACAAADLTVDGSPRDACLAALERARGESERLERALADAQRVTGERDAAVTAGQVAKSLGQHLDARHFEKWLLNRALRRLVAGASITLLELSQGGYSLALDDAGAFQVIDHRNADERRSARTLSGGETFLAALSLALALADHVAELAAHGSARLDALFLDEGFGTLDSDALDTVASALEELGARGRMVGLVTHVRELAERMPVRFEVRKGAEGSTVEKVVA